MKEPIININSSIYKNTEKEESRVYSEKLLKKVGLGYKINIMFVLILGLFLFLIKNIWISITLTIIILGLMIWTEIKYYKLYKVIKYE